MFLWLLHICTVSSSGLLFGHDQSNNQLLCSCFPPMSLNFDLQRDVESIMMNQPVRYVGQWTFSCCPDTDEHTDQIDRFNWTTEVVCKNEINDTVAVQQAKSHWSREEGNMPNCSVWETKIRSPYGHFACGAQDCTFFLQYLYLRKLSLEPFACDGNMSDIFRPRC